MLRKYSKNENGVVLIVVLMIVAVLMTLTVSILSLNISAPQIMTEEIKSIQAECWLWELSDMSLRIKLKNLLQVRVVVIAKPLME